MEKNKKSFGEIWCSLTTEQSEYLKDFINKQRQDAVEYYKSQQLLIADVKEIIEKQLLIDFCKSLELKAEEYNYLIPDEKYIDEYLRDN